MEEKISLAEIKEIIDLVRSEDKIEVFQLKIGDTEISISKNSADAGSGSYTGRSTRPKQQSEPGPAPAVKQQPNTNISESQPEVGLEPGDIEVKAPSVGTFYRRPKPGAEPFVEIGSDVSVGNTLCIVEVMKLMNSVKCETAGKIKKILVEDGQPVEFGQPLMIISKGGE